MSYDQFVQWTYVIGGAGVVAYLLLTLIGFFTPFPSDHWIIHIGKVLACVMVLLPLVMRYYFSQYMLLWLALALVAIGAGIKIKSRLGL